MASYTERFLTAKVQKRAISVPACWGEMTNDGEGTYKTYEIVGTSETEKFPWNQNAWSCVWDALTLPLWITEPFDFLF